MGSTRSTSGTGSEHEARLTVLGVGSIAEAIVTGLSASDPERRVVLSPRNPARSARLAAAHPNVSVASSNQAALDAADTVLLCLRAADAPVLAELSFRPEQRLITVMPSPGVNDLAALVGRVAAISRAIPAVAVADRAGLTPVYPAGSAAQTLFDELGGSMALASEQQLDATSAASATVATYFALLQAIAEWLAGRGVDERQARRLVAAVFAGASAELAHSSDFAELAAQHATPGGQNERLVARLRAAGMFGQLTDGLDALLAE
ncbi:MAG TPA: pyrroline-5-carboxylate reductase dimerization domain-containing protein [Micropruina sp.]|nr:pyrroline-5-carboxylate reductase dimerization domain-containing protein [Micropruina sp.]